MYISASGELVVMVEHRSVALILGLCLLVLLSLVISGVSIPLLADDSAEPEYQLIVIFRNDDIQPDHNDDLRRAVDQTFIDEEVPVTNAVIPTQDGESIVDDEAFCQELRRQQRDHPGLFEYSLHGFFHEPNEDGVPQTKGDETTVRSEFGGLSETEQRERIRDGKRIVSDCFDTSPQTFVPPYASYDDATVAALAAENITAVAGGGWFTESYYGETEPFEIDSVLHVPEDQGFVEDWETNEFYDQETLLEAFDDAYADRGVYVHGLHYWTFDSDSRLEQLEGLVQYMKQHDDVLFLTLEEFTGAYRDGRLTETDTGWSYTPVDDHPVYDTKR